ncbi:MAG TPA: hypothetical protein DD381_00995, partial [Lentisphaeria bacterium]|nr:hypothetical protein [Lentisphaeria bacterium]
TGLAVAASIVAAVSSAFLAGGIVEPREPGVVTKMDVGVSMNKVHRRLEHLKLAELDLAGGVRIDKFDGKLERNVPFDQDFLPMVKNDFMGNSTKQGGAMNTQIGRYLRQIEHEEGKDANGVERGKYLDLFDSHRQASWQDFTSMGKHGDTRLVNYGEQPLIEKYDMEQNGEFTKITAFKNKDKYYARVINVPITPSIGYDKATYKIGEATRSYLFGGNEDQARHLLGSENFERVFGR